MNQDFSQNQQNQPDRQQDPSKQASPSTPGLWLTLQARDAATLIDYYVQTFGFVETARYGGGSDGDGEVVEHAELLWPEGAGGIMLGTHRPGRAWSREPGTAGGYVVTADPDALYERALRHQADVVRPLADTDYGSREFVVRDPEGNLWSFGTYPGAAPTSDVSGPS